MTLGRRDVALAATEVYLAVGDTVEAARYARPACKEAWADGPPYARALALKRAGNAQALGMPEPALPPFDPKKVAPVPYEVEIRAFIEELRKEHAQDEAEEDEDDDEQPDVTSLDAPLTRHHWWAPWTWGRK